MTSSYRSPNSRYTGQMQPLRIKEYRLEQKKARKTVDWGGFFAFFGVSGVDHNRRERLEQQFEEEHYRNRVTLLLSESVPAGLYVLAGLPERLNWRPWRSKGKNMLVCDISDNSLEEFEDWWAAGGRQVSATPAGQ